MARGKGDLMSDNDILQGTAQIAVGEGVVKWSYVLPSGNEVTSDPTPESKMKGSAVIAWCQHVKDMITTEDELGRQSPIATSAPAEAPKAPEKAPTDPLEFVGSQLSKSETAYQNAVIASERAMDLVAETEKMVAQWRAASEALKLGENDND